MTDLAPIDITGLRPATLRDQPQPSLIWVDIDQLVIDRRYQRAITPRGRAMIQRIADGWDWRKSQPILVAGTAGGRYAVVDGQHRAHAAALCGIPALPAMLVPMSLQEQAQGFVAVNRERIKIAPPQLYNAELAAGTPWAVRARDAVFAAGCHLLTYTPSHRARKPGHILAVGLIRKMVEAGEADAVTVGLRAIRLSETGQECDEYGVDAWSSAVLSVWLRALATSNRLCGMPDLPGAFDRIDIFTLLDRCRSEARKHGGSPRQRAIDAVVMHLRGELAARAA